MKPQDIKFTIKGAIKTHYNKKTVKEGVESLVNDILSSKFKQTNKLEILKILTQEESDLKKEIKEALKELAE